VPQAGACAAHRNNRRRSVVGNHESVKQITGDGGAAHREGPESGLNREGVRRIAYHENSGEINVYFLGKILDDLAFNE
ncbi:MAG TPA: hypothetical protein VLR52_04030, partial [Bacteroidales bacterium]|nr:hypothetical protein [Bacteroidales bacterium]